MSGGNEEIRPCFRLRIHRGDDALQTGVGNLVVHCPRRGRLVSLEECRLCEEDDGFHVDRTERDSFLICLYGQEAKEERETVPMGDPLIRDLMTRRVVTVRPELPLVDLLKILVERSISGVPVVDAQQRPIGVVSKSDLLREEQASLTAVLRRAPQEPLTLEIAGLDLGWLERTTVGEIMMPFAFALPETATVTQAAGLMAYEGIHRVPVVTSAGEVVGILSSLDILRWLASARPMSPGST